MDFHSSMLGHRAVKSIFFRKGILITGKLWSNLLKITDFSIRFAYILLRENEFFKNDIQRLLDG